MNKNIGNYFLLGIAASYLALAVVQATLPGLLPMHLYVTVAYASLGISFLELIRSILKRIYDLRNSRRETLRRELDICEKHIQVLSKYSALEEDLKQHQEIQRKLKVRKEAIQNQKHSQWPKHVSNIVSCLQIVYICIMAAITMVKKIPNDLSSNRVICFNSLVSFALLFISFYVGSSMETDDSVSIASHLSDVEEIERYYLNLLDKATPSSNSSDK